MSDTFYEYHVFCCCNERPPDHPRGCCGKETGEAIRTAFKQQLRKQRVRGRMRINKSGCLDRCELGPCVVVYPGGVWYSIEEIDRDVPEIVREHIAAGRPVERLRLPDTPTKAESKYR